MAAATGRGWGGASFGVDGKAKSWLSKIQTTLTLQNSMHPERRDSNGPNRLPFRGIALVMFGAFFWFGASPFFPEAMWMPASLWAPSSVSFRLGWSGDHHSRQNELFQPRREVWEAPGNYCGITPEDRPK